MLVYRLDVCVCVVLKRLARKRLEKVIFKSRSKRAEGASHEDIKGRMFQAEAIAGAEVLRLGLFWAFGNIRRQGKRGIGESVQLSIDHLKTLA